MKPAALLLLALLAPSQGEGPPAPDPAADLREVFRENGIHLDLERGLCALDASVAVRDELLEYLLVTVRGAGHESLFMTAASPAVVNTAFLALGVEPGRNASWGPREPQPSEEELRAGVSPYDVRLPEGDGFYVYVGWRDGDETYFYRVEDLVRNLATGRAMQRHRWVYLGSRMIDWERPGEPVFAAEVLGNLINVAFFEQGDTLLTAAVEHCVDQTIWVGNSWLVPERGTGVKLVFARERLDAPPPGLLDDGAADTEGR